MSEILIKNATVVNEGIISRLDILIKDEIISSITEPGDSTSLPGIRTIDASGLLLLPGVIDDQVHFREPGLTQKGDIASESRAAVAGGITSFMEMPNTVPQTTTIDLLEKKYQLASEKSSANFSFYLGATNDNTNELMRADPSRVCGIKLFLGSSTGNMLVDNEKTLNEIFSNAVMPVAAHCEDEQIIRKNTEIFKERYGENIPYSMHPLIRSREACFKSSSHAVKLAEKYDARLHILHLSTADELKLFRNDLPLKEKRITAEVCLHHLWFDDSSYEDLGSKIKWNPAIKSVFDRKALREGVNNDHIDVVATDHAPHTSEEKKNNYLKCPSGGPLVQHSLVAMLELWHQKVFTLEKIVEKMCHNPAILFEVKQRGFLKEGYKADMVIVDPDNPWTVSRDNLLYKCGWSPFENVTFRSKIKYTIINGSVVYDDGIFDEDFRGQRLLFNR